eukprot:SAG22_NODE_15915_length_337_cov_0.689076_1_plen_43_part_10
MPAGQHRRLRVLTHNVGRSEAAGQRHEVCELIRAIDPEVVMLQ